MVDWKASGRDKIRERYPEFSEDFECCINLIDEKILSDDEKDELLANCMRWISKIR
ncbi:MAG: hypothetical protein HWN65_10125 [Candidatus Helarchaeota archaeon]|nr:hypothetical protein [Candidatus Helarchaeota archaeon]